MMAGPSVARTPGDKARKYSHDKGHIRLDRTRIIRFVVFLFLTTVVRLRRNVSWFGLLCPHHDVGCSLGVMCRVGLTVNKPGLRGYNPGGSFGGHTTATSRYCPSHWRFPFVRCATRCAIHSVVCQSPNGSLTRRPWQENDPTPCTLGLRDKEAAVSLHFA
jgi:hypothetical protein